MTNEEAIKVLNTILVTVNHHLDLPMTVTDINDGLTLAIEALKKQQEGEWIDEVVPVGLVGRGNRQRRCSLCNHSDIQAKTQKVPYCWFCGAKMKEGSDGKTV